VWSVFGDGMPNLVYDSSDSSSESEQDKFPMLQLRSGVGGDVGHYENFAALDQVPGSVRYTFSSDDPALRRVLVLHGRHHGNLSDSDSNSDTDSPDDVQAAKKAVEKKASPKKRSKAAGPKAAAPLVTTSQTLAQIVAALKSDVLQKSLTLHNHGQHCDISIMQEMPELVSLSDRQ
jgi:hypothetical protein